MNGLWLSRWRIFLPEAHGYEQEPANAKPSLIPHAFAKNPKKRPDRLSCRVYFSHGAMTGIGDKRLSIPCYIL